MSQRDWKHMRDLIELQERMNQLFETTQRRPVDELSPEADWDPAADVSETVEGIVIKIDLPEVSPEAIEVRVDGNQLIVSGERGEGVKPERYLRRERGVGHFARSFTLPEVIDRERIEAVCRDGVLRLLLPRRAGAQSRMIDVEVK
jgi:HSP20 family protein